MRIGAEIERKLSGGRRASGEDNRYQAAGSYLQIAEGKSAAWVADSRLRKLSGDGGEKTEEAAGEEKKNRSEAEKIYQAVTAGKKNPVRELRAKPKVPYEHLAKDGVIEYNGVCFVCDAETNSICLGDMTDKKNVLTIALSGGGHLKVNRNNLGELSRVADMFSPEDLNLIMRAIALDSKIQSVKKEMEDEEASAGGILNSAGQSAEGETDVS